MFFTRPFKESIMTLTFRVKKAGLICLTVTITYKFLASCSFVRVAADGIFTYVLLLPCLFFMRRKSMSKPPPPPLSGLHQIRSKRIAVSHVLFWQSGWYSARSNRLFTFNSLSLMIVVNKNCKAVTLHTNYTI